MFWFIYFFLIVFSKLVEGFGFIVVSAMSGFYIKLNANTKINLFSGIYDETKSAKYYYQLIYF